MQLCRIDEIPELSSKGFKLGLRRVFAVKKAGEIHVYENACPHIGITLEYNEDEFLDYDKNFIICSGHGALFSIETGYCIAGPCKGQSLRKIPHQLDQGWVVVPDQA